MKKAVFQSLYFEDFDVGDEFDSPTRTINESDLSLFAGLTCDYNLVHTDEEFAKKTMFGTRIAHGLLGLSIGMGLLQRMGILASTGMAYLSLPRWEFTAPIKIGDTIMSRTKVVEKRETKKTDRGLIRLEMSILNQRGEEVQRGEHLVMVARKPTSSS